MRRLLAILGLLTVLGAAGCGGAHTAAATAHGTAFSAGPVTPGSEPPPPPPPPPRR